MALNDLTLGKPFNRDPTELNQQSEKLVSDALNNLRADVDASRGEIDLLKKDIASIREILAKQSITPLSNLVAPQKNLNQSKPEAPKPAPATSGNELFGLINPLADQLKPVSGGYSPKGWMERQDWLDINTFLHDIGYMWMKNPDGKGTGKWLK